MIKDKINCLIVDDEKNARIAIRGILEEEFPEVEILGEAENIPEAVKAIHALKPQLIFLDIEMPGYSGLSLLEFFDENQIDFKIVFVTAYSEYAINAFELSAIDYLLKPVRKLHIQKVLEKLNRQKKDDFKILKQNLDPDQPKKILLSTAEGTLIVEVNHIMYIKADGSYSVLYLNDGTKLTVSKKLLDFENLETQANFMRIHRSHIININYLISINKKTSHSVTMSNKEELGLIQEKKAELMERIKLINLD